MRHSGEDWNELAQREPYFAVITDRRYLRDNLDESARRQFFESGEADVERLLATINQVGEVFTPGSALDFGCGVARLTLPLARRVERVTGCDISPAMLAIARQNAEQAGATNVTFVSKLDDVRGQQFDFICSLLVFQHMPVSGGLAALSSLLRLLAPRGVVALHFTLRRPGGPLRRAARRLRARSPFLHRMAGRFLGDTLALPYIQMNEYDERAIQHRMIDAIGVPALVLPRREGDIEGAIFVARRRTEQVSSRA